MAFLPDYQYRKSLVVDNTKIQSSEVDFPVLVELSSSNFDFSHAKSDGTDIRFTLSDGTTLLKFERELHDSGSEEAVYWVKIPAVSSSVDTTIYIYYGYPSASDGEDAVNVWDSDFEAVSHFTDLTTLYVKDSTVNNHTLKKWSFNRPLEASGLIDKAQSFTGVEDYIRFQDDADFELQYLTIEFWAQTNDYNDSNNGGVTKGSVFGAVGDYSYSLNFDNDVATGSVTDATTAYSTSTSIDDNNKHKWTLTFDGSNVRLYKDNALVDTTAFSGSISYSKTFEQLLVGGRVTPIYSFDGLIDEVRISKVARSTSWISASFYSENDTLLAYGAEEEDVVSIDETVTLNDNWSIQSNPSVVSLDEIVSLDDDWNIQPNPETQSMGETVSLDDNWSLSLGFSEDVNILEEVDIFSTFNAEETVSISEEVIINQSLEKFTSSENLLITEDSVIGSVGDIDYIYPTDLRTLIQQTLKFMTNLVVNLIDNNIYDTNLTTKGDINEVYDTDLRVRVDDIDDVSPGNLSDIIVKLDGAELTDVDFSSLKIQYNLNKTASTATFKLARRHDNLDYLIDGVTYSEITDENKIEVYDGTYKLLTAYITQIDAISTTDTVAVIAQDARYKLSRNSMEIEYGGKIEEDDENENQYNTFSKNVGTVINEVLSAINPYIAGYETVPFSTAFIPEYNKTYGDYASLLDNLIRQVANASWYIDENEYLRFTKIDSGNIKDLALSPLNGARHLYDVVISNVSLNKQSNAYAKSLNVKLGTHINKKWARRTFSGWLNSYVNFFNSLKEKTSFCFQQWGNLGQKWYCGINKTIYGYSDEDGWVLKPTIVVQYQSKDTDDDLPDITVGSGSPEKTIHLNSYGKKENNSRWEERVKVNSAGNVLGSGGYDLPYLTYVTDDTYDYQEYATDFANFELSQNNQLKTSAMVTLFLDAYKYYTLSLKDRINLVNTIGNNIYNNNNGFPLNIDSVTIDCSTRIVTLKLTNYGKSWAVRTANYLKNNTVPKVIYAYPKQNVVNYSSGL